MLRVASSERDAALRQTSALASSERLASLSSRVLSDASEARRQLAKEYATRRLEASRGAVELAAKALMRERDARDWLYRWARACRAKRVAKSAGRGMRRRYALRNLRRALAGWRAQAAHATGARRVVAARVGAARGRSRLTSAFLAWRGAKLARDAKKRRLATAAGRFRAAHYRAAREAMARWRGVSAASRIARDAALRAAPDGGASFFAELLRVKTRRAFGRGDVAAAGGVAAVGGWLASWMTNSAELAAARNATRELKRTRRDLEEAKRGRRDAERDRDGVSAALARERQARSAAAAEEEDRRATTGADACSASLRACEALRFAEKDRHAADAEALAAARDDAVHARGDAENRAEALARALASSRRVTRFFDFDFDFAGGGGGGVFPPRTRGSYALGASTVGVPPGYGGGSSSTAGSAAALFTVPVDPSVAASVLLLVLFVALASFSAFASVWRRALADARARGRTARRRTRPSGRITRPSGARRWRRSRPSWTRRARRSARPWSG